MNGLSPSNQCFLDIFQCIDSLLSTLPLNINPGKALQPASQPVCIPVNRPSRAWLRFYDHDSGLFLNCKGHNWARSNKGEKDIWPGKAFNLWASTVCAEESWCSVIRIMMFTSISLGSLASVDVLFFLLPSPLAKYLFELSADVVVTRWCCSNRIMMIMTLPSFTLQVSQ